MNWGDLLTDLDVLAEDSEAATGFGSSPIKAKRDTAGYWAAGRMERRGLQVRLHSVRREPTAWAYTGAAWADVSSTLSTKSEDDLGVAAYIQDASADYLLVGSPKPFRGLYVGMLDGTNTNSLSVLQPTYWDGGQWTTPTSLVDGTIASSISLAGGGRITWQIPDDWERRPYRAGVTADWLYYVRLKMAVVPSSSTLIGQLLPIRPSRLTRPTALYALGLFYQEGIAGTRGNWEAKADRFLKQAETELEIVLGGDGILDEFDVDESQAVGGTEASSVAPTTTEWLRG